MFWQSFSRNIQHRSLVLDLFDRIVGLNCSHWSRSRCWIFLWKTLLQSCIYVCQVLHLSKSIFLSYKSKLLDISKKSILAHTIDCFVLCFHKNGEWSSSIWSAGANKCYWQIIAVGKCDNLKAVFNSQNSPFYLLSANKHYISCCKTLFLNWFCFVVYILVNAPLVFASLLGLR